MPLLTKSKYLIGLECPKKLWTVLNEPENVVPVDIVGRFRMASGVELGKLAQKWYPDGVLVSPESNVKEALGLGKPLFEAGMAFGELYARADILVPNGDSWDIVEVKSAGSVKEEHLHDVAFQRYVFENAGVSIGRTFLMHINTKYVRHGDVGPDLFVQKDVTAEVLELVKGVGDRVAALVSAISSPTAPPGCMLKDCSYCWKTVPSVFELYMGGKRCYELIGQSIFSLKDIPETFKLNDKQKIQRECALHDKTHVNKEGISSFLSTLKEPLWYLDFETFNPAIPLYEGNTPYMQIPFQYSLHGDKHYHFLHSGLDDPRSVFLSRLQGDLGASGSILVFNATFEKQRLKELALAYPECGAWVENVVGRMVDLAIPFKNFDYYSPLQKGSCSLKAVVPAVTGRGYEGLEVDNGALASVLYTESMFKSLTPEEKEKVRRDLLAYCERDTEGMVWVVEKMRKETG